MHAMLSEHQFRLLLVGLYRVGPTASLRNNNYENRYRSHLLFHVAVTLYIVL